MGTHHSSSAAACSSSEQFGEANKCSTARTGNSDSRCRSDSLPRPSSLISTTKWKCLFNKRLNCTINKSIKFTTVHGNYLLCDYM